MMPHFFVTTKILLLACVLAACSVDTDRQADASQAPVQVLLLMGGAWHDYEAQEPLLIDAISERIPEIQWTVVHEGDKDADYHLSVLQEDNWAADYDLVVHSTSFGLVTDGDFVARMVEHHKDTPAVVIHSAVHSYRRAEPSAEPWFRFTGIQSMWHEEERTFTVENIAPGSPIMATFPEQWEIPITDELYVVEKVWGDITPLARAYGEDTGEYHTVAWKHEPEGTRVFATTLGHNTAMYEQSEFLDMVAGGIRWALGKSESP